jgi:hypothetical protein
MPFIHGDIMNTEPVSVYSNTRTKSRPTIIRIWIGILNLLVDSSRVIYKDIILQIKDEIIPISIILQFILLVMVAPIWAHIGELVSANQTYSMPIWYTPLYIIGITLIIKIIKEVVSAIKARMPLE